MNTEISKSYAAGLIDGEGCIAIRRKNNKNNGNTYYNLVVKVGMTGDIRCLEFLQSNWGGKINTNKVNGQSQWSIYCNQASEFLTDIAPYLIIKESQAHCALEFHKSRIGISSINGESYIENLSLMKEECYAA